jgi:molecular chaperone DnaK (HSP70)
VVAFKRSGLTVKCHAWDRNLGGRDIDELMYDHFCKEVAAKQKLDIRSLPKASFKLRTAVEKVRRSGGTGQVAKLAQQPPVVQLMVCSGGGLLQEGCAV